MSAPAPALATAVARDVLGRLNEFNFSDAWYLLGSLKSIPDPESDLREVADEAAGTCNVCLLGACFLSAVRMAGGFKVGDALKRVPDPGTSLKALKAARAHFTRLHLGIDIYDYLLTVFTRETRILMEIAFQNDISFGIGAGLTPSACGRARAFGKKIYDGCATEEDRDKGFRLVVRAVLDNVIKNEGHFVP